MIKAIIFDYNGVLTVPGEFNGFLAQEARHRNCDLAEIKKIVRHHWDLARVGAIKSELLWISAAQYFHCNPQELRQAWLAWFTLRPDLLLSIKKLKIKYQTVLLTNMIQDWFEQIKQEQHLNDYFHHLIASYEAQAAKPDIKIFNYTLLKLGLTPEECIFIDDQEKNTVAAARLGFKTILFSSTENLILQLAEHGVTI